MATKKELEAQVEQLRARLAELERGTLHVGVVQDKSGSMYGRVSPTVSGYNEYIDDLRRDEEADNIRLTLVQFDTSERTLYEGQPIQSVEPLTLAQYQPGGGTALYDAIDSTVTAISAQLRGNDRALILVMTDGQENSSQRITTLEAIKSLIKGKESTGRWTFVYLGADQDAWAAGTRLGFIGSNTVSYANTAEGIGKTYRSASGATASLASSPLGATPDFASMMDEADKDEDGSSD